MFLGGCKSLNQVVSDCTRDISYTGNSKVLEDCRGMLMSKSSADLMAKADEQKEKALKITQEIENSWWPWHPFKKIKAVNAFNKSKDYTKMFAANIKSDKIFQQYNSGSGDGNDKSNITKYVLPALIMIVLLIVLYFLLSKKRKPVEKPEESVIEDKVELKDAKKTDELGVNYDKLLESACKEGNISITDAISQYGNSRKAYEAINYNLIKNKN